MQHLYSVFPKANRFALFEDDLDTCTNLRRYLEQQDLLDKVYWNLLTHDCNLALTGPEEGWHESNQRGLGALGLVFSRHGVQDLLTSPDFHNRIRNGRHAADGMVIDVLKPLGYKEWIHNPSLLQHIGMKSTLGHKYGPMKGFRGTAYDPTVLLPVP
jgi:hypothetical protein